MNDRYVEPVYSSDGRRSLHSYIDDNGIYFFHLVDIDPEKLQITIFQILNYNFSEGDRNNLLYSPIRELLASRTIFPYSDTTFSPFTEVDMQMYVEISKSLYVQSILHKSISEKPGRGMIYLS